MEMPGLVRSLVADVLGLPHARVSTTALSMAGGFGQRDLWTAELAACAALLARRTGQPVCLSLDRADELRSSPKRPRCLVEHTLTANPDGRITSLQTTLLWDGGPYDSQALLALAAAPAGLLCPYDVKDAELTVQVARTHNARTAELVGGSLLPLVVALESQVDTLARDLGHHPTLVRRRNVPRAGARRSRAVLDVLTHAEPRVLAPISPWVKRGVGVALCRHRPALWHAAARVDVHADGSITLKTSAADTGAQHPVALAHLAAHVLQVDPATIHVRALPEAAPFSSQDARAVSQACSAVIRTLGREAARLLDVNVSRLKHDAHGFSAGRRRVTFAQAAAAAHESGVAPCGLGQGSVTAKAEEAWAGAVAEVDVDLATGLVKVTRVVETHEAGPPWHAAGLTREVEAGVRLGLGFALSEEGVMEAGVFRNASLLQALMPGSVDGPPVDVVLQPAGPLHAVAGVAVGVAAAAVRNAVANALGDAPLELPCTPERVMEVLVGRGLDPLLGVA
jgi:CO/xanthine dehydrogenase Mo-binding subunit